MSAKEKKSPQDEQMITRRRLLKTLGITAGTVAASVVIPGKWIKPIVDVGVLPAHAQMSPACQYTIALRVLDPGIPPVPIPSGGDMPPQIVQLEATVTPAPSPVGDVTFRIRTIVTTIPIPVTTDAAGVATVAWDFGDLANSVPGDIERIRASFSCANSNQWWKQVAGVGGP